MDMNQVEQTLSNTNNNNSSNMPVVMETQNVAVDIHPYARAQQSRLLPPRKCRPSPFDNKTNRSNPSSPEGPGPIRRPLSRSQIPTPPNARISHQDGPSELAFSPRSSTIPKPQPEPHPPTPYANQIRGSTQSQPRLQPQNPLHTVDKAFTLYSDRLYSSLHEFRAVCTTVIVHEQEERRRVHALCLKIMRERDLARQKVDALLMDCALGADVKREHQRKRSRDYATGEGAEDLSASTTGHAGGITSSSPRSVCPLNTSLSPVVSPEGSPFIAPILPSPPYSVSASAPPTSSSYMGSTSTAARSSSSPLRHPSRSLSPLDIGLRARDDRDTGAATQSTPPLKRRKSSDSSSFSSTSSVELPPPNPAPLLKTDVDCHAGYRTKADLEIGTVVPPGNFEHVDIMYIPSKSQDGTLVCRACLLDSTKSKFMPPSPLSPDSTASLPSPTSPTPIRTTAPSSPKPEPNLSSKAQTSAKARANAVKTLFGPTTFPVGTPWDVLRDHCVLEHPKECADVNRLHPAEVWELRKRLGGR